jgi:hypothetical protein
MRPYWLKLVQAFHTGDKERHIEFCDAMLQNMEDDSFLPCLIFSDETFHISGKVNCHNVCIWGTQDPRETVEHERDSPKMNDFCAISQTKGYGPFSKEKQLLGDYISKCCGNGSFHKLRQIMMTSFFSKMGDCHIGTSRFNIS